MTMREDISMETIWALFPAISLDWIDAVLDCLVFQHYDWLADDIGNCREAISVKMTPDLFRKDLLPGSLKSTACGRNVASQIKWLSCMFTSIFGDISMTIQAEALLTGEGWWGVAVSVYPGEIWRNLSAWLQHSQPQLLTANHPFMPCSVFPPSTSLFISRCRASTYTKSFSGYV